MTGYITPLLRADIYEAGAIALSARDSAGFTTDLKGVGDEVTSGDKLVSKFGQERLPRRFPGSRIIDEEYAKSHGLPTDDDILTLDFDPIDGTTNYRNRNPNCAISLGVSRRNVPLAGVVYQFEKGRMYWADSTGLAYCIEGSVEREIKVSKVRDLKQARVFYSMPYPHRIDQTKRMEQILAAVTPMVASCERLGSQVMEMMQIAQGDGEIFFFGDTTRWDMGGPVPIVLRAGGTVVDMKGNPYRIGRPGVVATNGLNIDPLLKIFQAS